MGCAARAGHDRTFAGLAFRSSHPDALQVRIRSVSVRLACYEADAHRQLQTISIDALLDLITTVNESQETRATFIIRESSLRFDKARVEIEPGNLGRPSTSASAAERPARTDPASDRKPTMFLTVRHLNIFL